MTLVPAKENETGFLCKLERLFNESIIYTATLFAIVTVGIQVFCCMHLYLCLNGDQLVCVLIIGLFCLLFLLNYIRKKTVAVYAIYFFVTVVLFSCTGGTLTSALSYGPTVIIDNHSGRPHGK